MKVLLGSLSFELGMRGPISRGQKRDRKAGGAGAFGGVAKLTCKIVNFCSPLEMQPTKSKTIFNNGLVRPHAWIDASPVVLPLQVLPHGTLPTPTSQEGAPAQRATKQDVLLLTM